MPARTIAITSSCKNPELAIEWCDYWYGEEGYYLLNFGVEGESYDMVDGKPVYTYIDENIWEFVTGKRDISEYDKFREEVKNNFDVDSYLDVLQKQYDRYTNK